jgi:hypothetical protein
VRGSLLGVPAAHVAAEMGVSGTTAYRWWNRYVSEGEAGLYDRSSRPLSCPHQTPADQRYMSTDEAGDWVDEDLGDNALLVRMRPEQWLNADYGKAHS